MSNTFLKNQIGLDDAIAKMLQDRIKKSVDECAAELAKLVINDYSFKLQQEVTRIVSQTIINVYKNVSFERFGPELIIKVKME